MDDALSRSYDEVPYPSDPFYETFPDALATPAYLAGMNPAPVDKARVLEIGCGTGENLIAMALVLPESRFLGIDLSQRQIEMGNAMVRALNLKNIELRAASILDTDVGEQDYILCHGVYSWCPPAVQERILTVCQERLSPDGVVYISYNLLPGARHIQIRRQMLLWGGRFAGDWAGRVQGGRRFFEEVARQAERFDPFHQQWLANGVKELRKAKDEYIVHEYLELYNEPLLFHEMVNRVERHGMQYLGESCRQTSAADLPPSLREWAQSRVELEQTLDFLRNASFRQSLFVRGGRALGRPDVARIANLRMNTLCNPVSPNPDVNSDKEEVFQADQGRLSTDMPLVKAILVALHAIWPRTFDLAELAADVRVRLDATDDPGLTDEIIGQAVLQCHASNLLALHVWVPPFAITAGERPMASPLARLQAATTHRVTNLRHRIMELNLFELALLKKLDGTRDRATLAVELIADGQAGGFTIERGGMPVRNPEALRDAIAQALEPSLSRLAYLGLLVS
jgi:SAM-dependent methyltransferase